MPWVFFTAVFARAGSANKIVGIPVSPNTSVKADESLKTRMMHPPIISSADDAAFLPVEPKRTFGSAR
jgi:hypothetical protein